jgi:hypothetical protein
VNTKHRKISHQPIQLDIVLNKSYQIMVEAKQVKAIAIGSVLLVGASIGIGIGVSQSKKNKSSVKSAESTALGNTNYKPSDPVEWVDCDEGRRFLRLPDGRKLVSQFD